MRTKLLAILTILFALLAPATAGAGEATDLVKSKQTQLFELIAQKKTDGRQRKLAALFDEMLAYDRFAQGSMGDKWSTLTADQQKTFSTLLTGLVRGNYRKNLERMLDYQIVYAGEAKDGAGIVVKSRAKHKSDKREPDIEIDFHLDTVGRGLRVIDIITERASLVKTYRSQFLKILKNDGFDKLIEKMRKKLDKLESGRD